MDNPAIIQAERTGYPPRKFEYRTPVKDHSDACDVCDTFAWDVKFKGTCLCSVCAKEEGIVLR